MRGGVRCTATASFEIQVLIYKTRTRLNPFFKNNQSGFWFHVSSNTLSMSDMGSKGRAAYHGQVGYPAQEGPRSSLVQSNGAGCRFRSKKGEDGISSILYWHTNACKEVKVVTDMGFNMKVCYRHL